MLNRVTKDLSRGSYGGELEAIMESYMQCYTFIFTIMLSDLGDNDDDDDPFIQQLIIKVCSENLYSKTYRDLEDIGCTHVHIAHKYFT